MAEISNYSFISKNERKYAFLYLIFRLIFKML